jgi:glycosyltransferase involved in cell wall biosynthesis
MKVSIGSRIVNGPWGGGNLFVKNLSNYLEQNGHKVIYDLGEKDIDLILLTDPRSRKESSSTFNHLDIQKYKKFINPDVSVVQRINECDERKNTTGTNQIYLEASNVADKVIFVSSWLRDLYLNIGMEKEKTSVVLAGSNTKIFNDQNSSLLKSNEKVKIVTHHWSSHANKGFKEYKQLDTMIKHPEWKDLIEFTYIGNTSDEYKFENSNIILPLAGLELANELKKHHIYITASVNEPSGNHHIEAAQCGLPILYLDSGGIPEYCKGYGVSFSNDFEDKLKTIIENYDFYKEKLKGYPFNSEKMCLEFVQIFQDLVDKQDKINTRLGFASNAILFRNKLSKFTRKNKISTLKSIIKDRLIK